MGFRPRLGWGRNRAAGNPGEKSLGGFHAFDLGLQLEHSQGRRRLEFVVRRFGGHPSDRLHFLAQDFQAGGFAYFGFGAHCVGVVRYISDNAQLVR